MDDALIIHQPPAHATATELLLLFHGVGASAEDMRPLGVALAAHRPQAWVISVQSPDPSDIGHGWQWFSVKAVSEATRPERVHAALPRFVQTVAQWQVRTGVDADATTLIGFSQGAIMALESTQSVTTLAARVIAIAGRFAQPPRLAPVRTSLHLLHGDEDRGMPVAHAIEATQNLSVLGNSVTLDRFPKLGHGIDAGWSNGCSNGCLRHHLVNAHERQQHHITVARDTSHRTAWRRRRRDRGSHWHRGCRCALQA